MSLGRFLGILAPLSMTNPSPGAPAQSDPTSTAAKRRRLEAELLIHQSDRSRLVRNRELLAVEQRSLLRDIELKRIQLSDLETKAHKLDRDLDMSTAEIQRLQKNIKLL